MSYKILVVLFILQSIGLTACKERIPNEFLNTVFVNKEVYKQDIIQILEQMEEFIKEHEGSFFSKEYYDSTQVTVDTIIYAPDFNRLAVFIIAKNPTYRQLLPDAKHKWYYNATCYLGVRQDSRIVLTFIGPSFSNSADKDKLVKITRETYFSVYAKSYKYNLSDIRFWDSSIWEEIELKRKSKKEFEEYKKTHPENVYEPK